MRRAHLLASLLVIICSVSLVAVVFAATNFKGGFRETFTDNGLTLSARLSFSGLGNEDIVVGISVGAQPTSSCTNPAGQTQPPGQNPAPTTVSGATAVPAGSIKNGNATVTVTTAAPVSPIPGAPHCPNPQWTEAISDMAFTSALTVTITTDLNHNGVADAGEPVQFTGTCSFTGPTSNGGVANEQCPQ